MELMERMVLLPNYAWLHLNSTSRKKCTHLEVIVYIIKLVPALVVGRVDEFLQREWKKLQIVVFAEYRLCFFHFLPNAVQILGYEGRPFLITPFIFSTT